MIDYDPHRLTFANRLITLVATVNDFMMTEHKSLKRHYILLLRKTVHCASSSNTHAHTFVGCHARTKIFNIRLNGSTLSPQRDNIAVPF